MYNRITDSKFFLRSADVLAPMLLGKTLCCNSDNGTIRLIITETEAYCHNDTACYGYNCYNDKAKRKSSAVKPLFEKCGTCCIYGGMILISCLEEGIPDNVLIRAAVGEDEFYNGPCRVAKALKANNTLNGENLLDNNAKIWLEDNKTDHYAAIKRKGLGKLVDKKDNEKKLRFIAI